MQNEYKVIRLENHALGIHCSYLMDEMLPDAVVPYLVERRLLSPEKAAEVVEMSSKTKKVFAILKALYEKSCCRTTFHILCSSDQCWTATYRRPTY